MEGWVSGRREFREGAKKHGKRNKKRMGVRNTGKEGDTEIEGGNRGRNKGGAGNSNGSRAESLSRTETHPKRPTRRARKACAREQKYLSEDSDESRVRNGKGVCANNFASYAVMQPQGQSRSRAARSFRRFAPSGHVAMPASGSWRACCTRWSFSACGLSAGSRSIAW
eukprot:6180147-Pleurochrysis_carterae.AAC.1